MGEINMAEVKIEDDYSEGELFVGEFSYIEGGIDEKGRPGFHIAARDNKGHKSFTFYLEFKDIEEYKEFMKKSFF